MKVPFIEELRVILMAILSICIKIDGQEQYQQASLDIHNGYRRTHSAGSLTISADLNTRAVRCAEYYAAKGTIDHSCPHKGIAGENLWQQWGSFPTKDGAARSAASSWYSEESFHNYNFEFQPQTGHFSQMVWNSSREYGFGVGNAGSTVVGCGLYLPRGNILGEFRANVFPPMPSSGNNVTSVSVITFQDGNNAL